MMLVDVFQYWFRNRQQILPIFAIKNYILLVQLKDLDKLDIRKSLILSFAQ